jgi:hypothetical protein
MVRLALAVTLLAPLAAPAEPEKPVAPKEDELAVLADPKSPDRQTVLDRYAGKVLKIEGRVSHAPGGTLNAGLASSPTIQTATGYSVTLPRKKPGDPEVVLRGFEWTKDPAAKRTIDQVDKKSREGAAGGEEGRPEPRGAPHHLRPA